MQAEQQKKILAAFQLVMRPVVKLLFKFGIGYAEFAEVVKTAFVDVATSEFGLRGRPTNISRVAVMTGLTRKEVRRLRTKLESGEETVTVKTTPMTEILSRWHSEDDYLDDRGRPAPLPFSGNGDEKSFSSLVKKFGGDVPPGAMRTELKRVGSVVEDTSGRLTLAKRSYFSSDSADQVVTSIVHAAYPLMSNIEIGYSHANSALVFPLFSVHSLNVDESNLKRLGRIARDRLSDTAESMDDLFMAYESEASVSNSDRSSSDGKKPVMVGLYYFEERDGNAKYEW